MRPSAGGPAAGSCRPLRRPQLANGPCRGAAPHEQTPHTCAMPWARSCPLRRRAPARPGPAARPTCVRTGGSSAEPPSRKQRLHAGFRARRSAIGGAHAVTQREGGSSAQRAPGTGTVSMACLGMFRNQYCPAHSGKARRSCWRGRPQRPERRRRGDLQLPAVRVPAPSAAFPSASGDGDSSTRQPSPVSNHPFCEEILPHFQSKPPQEQLNTMSSPPVANTA